MSGNARKWRIAERRLAGKVGSAILTLPFLASAAYASPITAGPATYSGSIQSQVDNGYPGGLSTIQTITGPEVFTAGGSGPQGSTGQTNVTVTNGAPGIFYSASGTTSTSLPGNVASVINNATLTYSFVITGPTTTVPVLIKAAGGIDQSALPIGLGAADFSDVATFQLFQQLPTGQVQILRDDVNFYNRTYTVLHNNAIVQTGQVAQGAGWSGGFTENVVQALLTNTVYSVSLRVDGGFSINRSGLTGSDSVFVDPQFFIDVSASDPSLYSIQFSSGISNFTSGVPEPSTWVMMILGFAGVGFSIYRRRNQTLDSPIHTSFG